MWKRAVSALVVASVTLVAVQAGLAAKPGNSLNAKACQKHGWETYVRADQSAFSDEQECVSYAAQGGTLTVPTTNAWEAACILVGGAFSIVIHPAPRPGYAYRCTPVTYDYAMGELGSICLTYPDIISYGVFRPDENTPWTASCDRSEI
jgi:hypothetical protein